MDLIRILIALNSEPSVSKLRAILDEVGCMVVDYAADGNECIRKIKTLRPDFTVLEYGIPLLNGFEVSKIALKDKLSDILLIVSPEQEGIVRELRHEYGFAYLVKPINRAALTQTVELMVKNRRRVMQLEKENEELRNSLDTRKDIEKAKGLLMKALNISEADAFKRIQKQSMDKGIPMKEIAKAIILTYDM